MLFKYPYYIKWDRDDECTNMRAYTFSMQPLHWVNLYFYFELGIEYYLPNWLNIKFTSCHNIFRVWYPAVVWGWGAIQDPIDVIKYIWIVSAKWPVVDSLTTWKSI